MDMRKSDGKAWLLALVLCVTGTTLLTGCGGDDEKEEKPAPQKTSALPLPQPQVVTGG